MTRDTHGRIWTACHAVCDAQGADASEDAMAKLFRLVLDLPCDEWPNGGMGMVTTLSVVEPTNVLTMRNA